MAVEKNKYILTLSCKDVMGIVASVSGFLRDNGGFIIESAQFGDPYTNRFFMRTLFETGDTIPALSKKFAVVANKFHMEWNIFDTAIKPKVLLMVSKQGHCYNDILHRAATGNLDIEITAIVSNHKDQEKMAKWYEIPYHYLPITPETKDKQERKQLELIKKYKIDLVVLARYMQVLSENMCKELHGKAINIHHSFLPSFKGANPYKQAYDRGVKIIGATAHYVTEDLDEGPIIEQEIAHVNHAHAPEHLKEMGRDIESLVLSRAIKLHSEHRIILNGNKTVIFK